MWNCLNFPENIINEIIKIGQLFLILVIHSRTLSRKRLKRYLSRRTKYLDPAKLGCKIVPLKEIKGPVKARLSSSTSERRPVLNPWETNYALRFERPELGMCALSV